MRDDPNLDKEAITACLREQYGVRATEITFLPIGYDFSAAVYEVTAEDGASYFLKTRAGPVNEPGLLVPRALQERGIGNVLAPLRTRSGELWSRIGERSVILYPFIRGENAMVAGMTDQQWQAFGATLRAIHDSGLHERFQDQLPAETFAIPSAALVREVQAGLDGPRIASPAAEAFAACWTQNSRRITGLLDRVEALGRRLRAKPFEHVLCHADIHAANILVEEGGPIHLIDWDGPLIAPRERDLLFVVGSRIARTVLPREEALFFAGYGPVEIDAEALIYYRYERIIQDLGEFGTSVFLDEGISEAVRTEEVALAMSFFAPGGDIDAAELVALPQVPPVTI